MRERAAGFRTLRFLLLITLLTACAQNPHYGPFPDNTHIAAETAVYAAMAAESYREPNRIYFPLASLGWLRVDNEGKTTIRPAESRLSGLAYDIFEHKDGKRTVIALRGTDGANDWIMSNVWNAWFGFSPPGYWRAIDLICAYRDDHPERQLVVVGHSLGGGMAISASVHLGLDAYAFNSSPRIFDGSDNRHAEAKRTLIYVEGEDLDAVRKKWPKIFDAVPRENIHAFDFPKISEERKHRSDCMAYYLIEAGAKDSKDLKDFLEATNLANKGKDKTGDAVCNG